MYYKDVHERLKTAYENARLLAQFLFVLFVVIAHSFSLASCEKVFCGKTTPLWVLLIIGASACVSGYYAYLALRARRKLHIYEATKPKPKQTPKGSRSSSKDISGT